MCCNFLFSKINQILFSSSRCENMLDIFLKIKNMIVELFKNILFWGIFHECFLSVFALGWYIKIFTPSFCCVLIFWSFNINFCGWNSITGFLVVHMCASHFSLRLKFSFLILEKQRSVVLLGLVTYACTQEISWAVLGTMTPNKFKTQKDSGSFWVLSIIHSTLTI